MISSEKKARRLQKETKGESWYNEEGDKISAPLIISPMDGKLTSEIKEVCDRYSKSTNIKVATRTRAGQPLRGDPKSEPFRRIGCRRENCLVCSSGKPGQCERNGSGYRIICTPCLETGKTAIYEGEREETVIPGGWSIRIILARSWMTALSGSTAAWSMVGRRSSLQ